MVETQLSKQLIPEEVRHSLLAQGRKAFTLGFGQSQLLLVRIPGADTGLLEGLLPHAQSLRKTVQPQVIAYKTGAAKTSPERKSRAPGSDQIRTALIRDTHFVVSLQKRVGSNSPSPDRISVGRAPNTDIVLRDATVSKFHGWFQLPTGEAGRADIRDSHPPGSVAPSPMLSLADANSRNGTHLNGARLVARELRPVSLGDRICFGSIEVVLCSPEMLWDAVRGLD